MEEVIHLLYDIEEKANQIVNRAGEEKISLHDALEKDIEQLDQSVATENIAKLSVLQTQVNNELAKEKQSLIDDCNKKLADLETHYNQNHDVLVDKVFQSLIKA